MQAQVEALYNLSIHYNIYDPSPASYILYEGIGVSNLSEIDFSVQRPKL
jgi:hypothetical protein